MIHHKPTNNQILNRGHSFINRTPHIAINISNKSDYNLILLALSANVQSRAHNKVGGQGQCITVRCVKIEDCNFQQPIGSQSSYLTIPHSISTNIFEKLTRLIITKCKIAAINFKLKPDDPKQTPQTSDTMFQNLQQFDGTLNNLIQIPEFLYKCPKLTKLNLCNNHIDKIDNRLTQLTQLKYIGLLANHITLIGVGFCLWVVQKQIGLDLQWHMSLMRSCLQQMQQFQQQLPSSEPVSMESTRRIGTAFTQADYHLNCDQIIPQLLPIPPPIGNPTLAYLNIVQQIPALFRKNSSSKMINAQIETLVLYEHLEYLSIVKEFVTKEMCEKYINNCFSDRKYASLDFLFTCRNNLSAFQTNTNREILKQRKQNQQKPQPIVQKVGKGCKQNKQNKLATRKQIKMLQPNSQKNNQTFVKNKDSTNSNEEPIITDHQAIKFLIPIIMTFNLENYKQLPLQFYDQITKDDLAWILNQLEVVEKWKKKDQIQEVISSSYFQRVINNTITKEEDLEYLANIVHHKSSLKKIFLFAELKFLQDYDFTNVSILKLILRLEDFLIFKKFERKYKKFTKALFSNTPRSHLVTTFDKKLELVPISITKSIDSQPLQGTSWKYIVSPNSKLYKYIFKLHKRYIANQLEVDHNKNLHFPEYIPPQSCLIRNDVHDYDMLKDYQEFQASFHHKDLKLHVRHSNIENNLSLAKKIYMQVINQTSLKIRHLGKSKEKSRSGYSALNKTSVCLVKSVDSEPMIEGLNSPKLLSCDRTQKQGRLMVEKPKIANKTSNKNSKRISSIQVSARKQNENGPKKKKNGIIIYSSSQTQIKGIVKTQKQDDTHRKTIYLDLSKSSKPLSHKTDTINLSTGGKLQNSNRNQVKADAMNNVNQIQCSTFDVA